MIAHINHTTGKSVKRNYYITPRIYGLLPSCFPPNISRFIISVVVDSSKRHSTFRLTNIFKKIFKIIPSFTYGNSSCSIIFKRFTVWIQASLTHGNPYPVNSSFISNLCMIVFCASGYCGFSFEASTRLGVSASEASFIHDNFSSAITNTKNSSYRVSSCCFSGWNIFDNFKSSKSFTDNRYSGRHGIGCFNVMFSGGRSDTTDAHRDKINQKNTGVNEMDLAVKE